MAFERVASCLGLTSLVPCTSLAKECAKLCKASTLNKAYSLKWKLYNLGILRPKDPISLVSRAKILVLYYTTSPARAILARFPPVQSSDVLRIISCGQDKAAGGYDIVQSV